jgi:hypothetical protein
VQFIVNSDSVNRDVLITSVNIYLLMGIISAYLTMTAWRIYPEAYSFPDHITNPILVHFLYYSFITMSTVGYGDVVPRIPETQTLSYLISIAGQLYMAIIISFLVGKYIVHQDRRSSKT